MNCRTISLVIFGISFVGVLAACIAGFATAPGLTSKITAIECSLLRFYLDVVEGEIKETKPKWIGIKGIIKKLDDISAALKTVKDNSNSAFGNDGSLDNLEKSKNEYYALMDNSYNNNKEKRTTNPNPDGKSNQVIPEFIKVRFYLKIDVRPIRYHNNYTWSS